MRNPSRSPRNFILFLAAILALSLGSHLTSAQLDTRERRERTIIIRYDGTQITLTNFMLELLFTSADARKKIDDLGVSVDFYANEDVEQPSGVFAGIIAVSSEKKIGDEDEKFRVIQDVAAKILNKRLYRQRRELLHIQHKERLSLLAGKGNEIQKIRKEMEEKVANGSPATFQTMYAEMIKRVTEQRIQSDVNVVRAEALQEAVAQLKKERNKLTEQRNLLQQQIGFETDELQKMEIATSFEELRKIEVEMREAQTKYGKEHPELAKFNKMREAMTKQVDLQTRKLKEKLELQDLLEQIDVQLTQLNDDAARTAKEYQAQLLQQNVADVEQDLLKRQSDEVRQSLSDTAKVVPALESKLQMLVEELQMLQEEKMQLDAEIRNLQPVTVEIW